MSTLAPDRPLLTVAAVAERLNLSEKTVRRLIGAELLPGALRIGGSVRVDPDALEEWLAGKASAVGSSSSTEHASSAVGSRSSVGAGAFLPSRPHPLPRTSGPRKRRAVEPGRSAQGER